MFSKLKFAWFRVYAQLFTSLQPRDSSALQAFITLEAGQRGRERELIYFPRQKKKKKKKEGGV